VFGRMHKKCIRAAILGNPFGVPLIDGKSDLKFQMGEEQSDGRHLRASCTHSSLPVGKSQALTSLVAEGNISTREVNPFSARDFHFFYLTARRDGR
jgi:hypothetical protein